MSTRRARGWAAWARASGAARAGCSSAHTSRYTPARRRPAMAWTSSRVSSSMATAIAIAASASSAADRPARAVTGASGDGGAAATTSASVAATAAAAFLWVSLGRNASAPSRAIASGSRR
ncbi:MAG: hypothetical protein IPL61_40845 [Myxococcales bacterium]|nr:hypothetical protein [Myxococcales bacterium]